MSRVDRLICHVMPKAFLMALTGEGRLLELQVVRRDRPNRVDSIFLGRLERLTPALVQPWIDAFAEFHVIPKRFPAGDLVK